MEFDNKVLAWKMIGDCSLLVIDVPVDTELRVPAVLVCENSNDDSKVVKVADLLRLGTE